MSGLMVILLISFSPLVGLFLGVRLADWDYKRRRRRAAEQKRREFDNLRSGL